MLNINQDFLSDRNDCDFSLPKMEQFLRSFGYSPENFWMRLFHVGELNFALSLLRYLPSALDTLYAFLLIIRILDDHLGAEHSPEDGKHCDLLTVGA